MTRPAVIYFGPDGGRATGPTDRPKIFLRALLISNSKRGRVVENIYATLTRGESRQNFNVWVYGDDKLTRGSGMHVSDSGIATNHHFLLPADNSEFRFKAGVYQLDVFAKLLGDRGSIKLLTQGLRVSDAEAKAISTMQGGLYFDWGPQGNQYESNLHKPEKAASLAAGLLGSGL